MSHGLQLQSPWVIPTAAARTHLYPKDGLAEELDVRDERERRQQVQPEEELEQVWFDKAAR